MAALAPTSHQTSHIAANSFRSPLRELKRHSEANLVLLPDSQNTQNRKLATNWPPAWRTRAFSRASGRCSHGIQSSLRFFSSFRSNQLLTRSMSGTKWWAGPIHPPTAGALLIAAGSDSNWIVRLTGCKQITSQPFDWRHSDQWKRLERLFIHTPPSFGPIREQNGNLGVKTVLRSEGVSYEAGYYCGNFSIT